ncbi:hypothetical protein [Pseudomonas phage K4]|uniref:Uncharacterized protein n=1 Tax=Pseudomonas phage TC6 TaxID=2060947 RepID=A0A2H5BQB3_9CAUD|nr:hypothetical protein ORF039 [Pseudomonas phage PA11]YP_009304493.1 hypothetical protein BJD45_gp14 [Pseudomonas phage O4]ATG86250.1 hypothetical protein [Pseudomonas phage IME180]AUG88524.1 hypothetical protein [Pseudomonas phage TC6]QVJ12741.1 hypothetical protein [Pseudomonas phage PSA11]QWS70012.1 hypothetical protein [Pseudomonas phage K4]UCW44354.1 hypothetical protein [Pseudomonas phage PPAY]UCW44457.1 hypothetical protein [Pseudomonas phage PPAT]UVN13521.1 hypothetical protein FBP
MSVEYKGYQIVNDGTYGFKEIKPLGKGSVHMSLRGKFTNDRIAKVAIDTFLSKKVDTNGKDD